MPIYRSTDNGDMAAAGQEDTDPAKRMLGCYDSSDGGKRSQSGEKGAAPGDA